jgi:flagellar biosynthesis GTPase FlhF
MGRKDINEMTEAIFEELKHFKEKFENAYNKLYQKREEGRKNIESQKEGRSPTFQREIDTYLKGLDIIFNKEQQKYKDTLKTIDIAIEEAEKVNNKAKKETISAEEIINAINSLIPFIEKVYNDSQFIINRIGINNATYTLYKQKELKQAGLNFPEKKQFLEKELADIKPDLKIPTTSLGAFKAARGRLGEGVESRLYDLKDRKQKEWLSPSALDRKRQEEDKGIIRKHLTDISPDNLHTIPKKVQEKIQNYIYSRNIARQAANDKNEPYPETEIEKLIYAKTGIRGEEIVGRETLFPKPDTEGLTNKKLEETSPAPEKVKARKGKPKVKTEETIEKIIPEAALGVNTSSIAEVKPDAASVANTSSSGDGGGGKRRRRRITKVGGRKGGSSGGGGASGGGGGLGTGGGSSGSSSPINTAPEINRGKTSSPGEVSDEMLKIIEEAVFNGAARAFSQFSNSPISGPSEFSDSTIDKIGNTVYEAMKKALDYYSASPAFNMVLTAIEPSVIKLLKDELGGLSGGGGTGNMDKLAEEMRLSRESNEKLAKMSEARRKKAKAEATKKKKEREKEKQRIADPNSPESQAKKKKEADAAEREQKRKDREQKRIDKENPNSPENLAKAAEEEEKRKKKEEDDEKKKLNAARQADPFRKRLRTIFKEGEQELSFLYAKVDSFAGWIPGFNDAILSARKKALETLREGYEAFDKKYASSGSAFKGMMASIKAMYSISPFTVIVAGLTTIGVLLGKTIFNAAQKLNTQIKEISAELGTSNRQSYEMFKNAMNAQTQFENLHASLRDVMDAQKGILGDSGILLRTNDKALSAIADNAKNIGLSVESAGAFYENLRMKGAGDTEANNVMTASLELADKRGFSPQSIVDDIAQNAEFASKYFSKITKDSKSAHQNLIETNIQVKNLGLNFQKAAKMTQHLLSFEQSITAEVEASVALGTHVDIGKARELLLQDDVAGAMTQMMNAIPGGYEGFQSQDFAQRQLSANLLGLEVSELERSLYLREKIKLSNSEDLELAMKHDDYLKKIAGTNDELYRTELNKVQAAERYNTSIEKLSVSFRYALAPVLEAVVPVVDLLADAINKLAGVVKSFVGGVTGANERGEKEGKGSAAPTMIKMGLMGAGGLLMANVMGGHVLKLLRGKLGGSIKGKIGEIVGKVRGGVDTLTGTLGTKTNPMYVISLGGGMDGFGGGGGGVGGGGAGGGGRFVNGKWRSQAVLDRAESMRNARNARIPRGKVSNYAKIAQFFSKMKPGSLGKLGTGLSLLTAGLEINDRQQQGQSNTQAVAAAGGGVAGSILGMKGGALVGAKLGTMIGTAIAGPIGAVAGAGIGAGIGGFVGGTAGYYAGGAIVDSQFKEGKKDPSYQTQPFQYQGMGLSATGSIYGGVNKPKPIGTPVETSMVDMTPTTFKTTSSGISEINPNYGTTSMARESVMVNTLSKSVEATALMKSVKEKNIEKDKVHKEMMEQQLKILESIREKINQPAVAFFTDEGRRQVINQSRVRNSH